MTKQKIKQETQNKTDTQIDENISIEEFDNDEDEDFITDLDDIF